MAVEMQRVYGTQEYGPNRNMRNRFDLLDVATEEKAKTLHGESFPIVQDGSDSKRRKGELAFFQYENIVHHGVMWTNYWDV